jgi:hypothetical protein
VRGFCLHDAARPEHQVSVVRAFTLPRSGSRACGAGIWCADDLVWATTEVKGRGVTPCRSNLGLLFVVPEGQTRDAVLGALGPTVQGYLANKNTLARGSVGRRVNKFVPEGLLNARFGQSSATKLGTRRGLIRSVLLSYEFLYARYPCSPTPYANYPGIESLPSDPGGSDPSWKLLDCTSRQAGHAQVEFTPHVGALLDINADPHEALLRESLSPAIPAPRRPHSGLRRFF